VLASEGALCFESRERRGLLQEVYHRPMSGNPHAPGQEIHGEAQHRVRRRSRRPEPGGGRSALPRLVARVAGLLLVALLLGAAQGPQRGPPPGHADTRLGARPVGDARARPVLPPPDASSTSLQGEGPFCLYFYTGTIKSTLVISNPAGVTGLKERSLANVDQRIVGRSPTSLEIEITVRRYVETQAPYPVDAADLPDDALSYLTPQERWIQSDHPAIVARASALVAGATTQADAVQAILAWVRARVAYDLTSRLPWDALSTLENRSAICGGFANLAVALMRAAGIPARVHVGCVGSEGWGVPVQGGWHAWIETYFPDVGWVASDPQTTANYVDTSHIFGGFHQCGWPRTVISRTHHQVADGGVLCSRRTSYTDTSWPGLEVAHVPGVDQGDQLQVPPRPVEVALTRSRPLGGFAFQIEDLSCQSDTRWIVETDAPWLHPGLSRGKGSATLPVSVDATSMQAGVYTATVKLREVRPGLEQAQPLSISVTLRLTGQPQAHSTRLFLPLAMAGGA